MLDPDPHQHEKWDPDPHQNVLDPPHCSSYHCVQKLISNKLTGNSPEPVHFNRLRQKSPTPHAFTIIINCFRGQGIGLKLVEAALENAQQ